MSPTETAAAVVRAVSKASGGMSPTETAAAVVRAVSKASGVDCGSIIGKRRVKAMAQARWACWLAMRERGHTFQEIGTIFLDREHSTVVKGVQSAIRLRRKSSAYDAICNAANALKQPFEMR